MSPSREVQCGLWLSSALQLCCLEHGAFKVPMAGTDGRESTHALKCLIPEVTHVALIYGVLFGTIHTGDVREHMEYWVVTNFSTTLCKLMSSFLKDTSPTPHVPAIAFVVYFTHNCNPF